MILAICPPPAHTDWEIVILVAAVSTITTILTGAAIWLSGQGFFGWVARQLHGL